MSSDETDLGPPLLDTAPWTPRQSFVPVDRLPPAFEARDEEGLRLPLSGTTAEPKINALGAALDRGGSAPHSPIFECITLCRQQLPGNHIVGLVPAQTRLHVPLVCGIRHAQGIGLQFNEPQDIRPEWIKCSDLGFALQQLLDQQRPPVRTLIRVETLRFRDRGNSPGNIQKNAPQRYRIGDGLIRTEVVVVPVGLKNRINLSRGLLRNLRAG